MPEASNRSRVTDLAAGAARDLFEAGLNEAASGELGTYGRSFYAPGGYGDAMLAARTPGAAGCR
jgi:hypothetical protein